MRCSVCGEELREGAKFCPVCGTATSPETEAARPGATVVINRDQSAIRARPDDAGAMDDAAISGARARSTMDDAAASGMRGRPADTSYDPNLSGARARSAGSWPPPDEDMTQPTSDARGSGGYRSRPADDMGTSRGGAAPSGRMGGMQAPQINAEAFSGVMPLLSRLLRFDTSAFADVYRDTAMTVPAFAIGAIALLLSGLGGLFFVESTIGFEFYELGASGMGEFILRSVILGTLFALGMVVAWAGITKLLLKQLGGVDADVLGLARVLALAMIPMVIALLLGLNEAYVVLMAIGFGAVLSLALIGVLEAVDVRPGPAWLATLAGFAVFAIVLGTLGYETRDFAPGFFVFP